MKAVVCFFILFLCLHANSQRIKYSKEHVQASFPDAVQLVPNISGYHHLLCFDINSKPALYVFDNDLKWIAKNELSFKLKEATELQVISFKNFYFLYLHERNSNRHEIWKISPKGNAEDFTAQLGKVMDSAAQKSTMGLQFFNQQENLFILSHTYYDALKNIISSVLQVDDELNLVNNRKVYFPFDMAEEKLQQVVLTKSSLLVSKTSRSDEAGNSLEVMRVPFDTSQVLTAVFNSPRHTYIQPHFQYSAADSSMLLYTGLRGQDNATRFQSSFFITKLDHLLVQQIPFSIYKTGASNFFWVKEKGWLNMQSAIPLPLTRRDGQKIQWPNSTSQPQVTQRQLLSSIYDIRTDIAGTFHFIVLNDELKRVKDSLMPYQKDKQQILPFSYASFQLGKTAMLLFAQKFAKKYNGLLMVKADEEGNIESGDLPVYDQYEFLLSQLKPVNDRYFMLPYLYKREIGLVKVEME